MRDWITGEKGYKMASLGTLDIIYNNYYRKYYYYMERKWYSGDSTNNDTILSGRKLVHVQLRFLV